MEKGINKLADYYKNKGISQHYDMNTQGSNRYHPLPLIRLREILLKESNLPDTHKVILKSPIQGTKLKGGRKAYNELWSTYIVFNGYPILLHQKQFRKHDYWRGIGGQEFKKIYQEQYEFYRIEITKVDYTPYRTKHNYKVDEGGGWTSDSPIFCKDGIYYAQLT